MTSAAAEISGPVRSGRQGVPFDISRLDLPALGYVEEEYFLSGTATCYRRLGPAGTARWDVAPRATAPFRTRILVRRPAEAGRFNGTVVVEWLNVSAFMDASVEWTYTHTELIRGGYAWAGVSAQHAGVTGSPHPGQAAPGGGLKGFDPERYGELSHPGDDYSYGIFTQAGQALRSCGAGGPLAELAGARLVAAGQSLAAYRLATYINAVDPIAGAYDGYLLHSRPDGAAPLELPTVVKPGAATALEPVPLRPDLRVPVLALQTETDVITLGQFSIRQDDTGRFRLWEVAGTAHADTYAEAGITDTGNLPAGQLAQALRPRTALAGTAQDHLVNSAPQHHYVATAAVSWLHKWVHDGILPPAAPRLSVTRDGTPALVPDEHGNATGGIRTPWVDVPLATLSGVCAGSDPLTILFGSTRPFPAATIHRLYPGQAAYLNAFETSLKAATGAGFLLPADEPAIMSLAAEQYLSAEREA
jgi:hypothetical protein